MLVLLRGVAPGICHGDLKSHITFGGGPTIIITGLPWFPIRCLPPSWFKTSRVNEIPMVLEHAVDAVRFATLFIAKAR